MSKSLKKNFLKENLKTKVSPAIAVAPPKGSGFEGMLGQPNGIPKANLKVLEKQKETTQSYEKEERVQVGQKIRKEDFILLKALSHYQRISLKEALDRCYSAYFEKHSKECIEEALDVFKNDHPELAREVDFTYKNRSR